MIKRLPEIVLGTSLLCASGQTYAQCGRVSEPTREEIIHKYNQVRTLDSKEIEDLARDLYLISTQDSNSSTYLLSSSNNRKPPLSLLEGLALATVISASVTIVTLGLASKQLYGNFTGIWNGKSEEGY